MTPFLQATELHLPLLGLERLRQHSGAVGARPEHQRGAAVPPPRAQGLTGVARHVIVTHFEPSFLELNDII